MRWQTSHTLVTGGASFIGSHLVDALLDRGARIRVADNLSSGTLDNLQGHLDAGRVEFVLADLRDPDAAGRVVRDVDTVFHLAADHGGRGYLDTHQAECATNLVLDGVVFTACREARVERIVYASSGCVYPMHLQGDPRAERYLTESMVGPPYDPDQMYGWAKLVGELTLRVLSAEAGIKSVCCRYFTAYGERGHENHALMAMIARAFIQQDPFTIWGTGEQIRNWTHVDDIVAGTILAAEHIDDGTAVNLGTMERTRVIDAAREVLRYSGHDAPIVCLPDMPTGPLNRVADHTLATERLGWRPTVAFDEGLRRTVDWYCATHDRARVAESLETRLLSR